MKHSQAAILALIASIYSAMIWFVVFYGDILRTIDRSLEQPSGFIEILSYFFIFTTPVISVLAFALSIAALLLEKNKPKKLAYLALAISLLPLLLFLLDWPDY